MCGSLKQAGADGGEKRAKRDRMRDSKAELWDRRVRQG